MTQIIVDAAMRNKSKNADGLLSLHQGSVVDFVNADNFGFIKDRRHVAGSRDTRSARRLHRPGTVDASDA